MVRTQFPLLAAASVALCSFVLCAGDLPAEAKTLTFDVKGKKLELVLLPKGKFIMGSPASEAKRSDDEQQHEVELTHDFYMCKFHVTQEQFETVMGSNPSEFKDKTDSAKRPVDSVSWPEAQEFCKKLNELLKDKLPEGRVLRLPTEAEWEYGCRAGTTTPFNTGETIGTDQANYKGTAPPYDGGHAGEFRNQTTPVDKFKPNAFGLHDMHGNLFQWCQDVYQKDYEKLGGKNPVNNSDIKGDEPHVLRGGNWGCFPEVCRSASRSAYLFVPGVRERNFGFRLVLSSALAK
jgi:formylglycine-generating enzyme required for sulfatase activity